MDPVGKTGRRLHMPACWARLCRRCGWLWAGYGSMCALCTLKLVTNETSWWGSLVGVGYIRQLAGQGGRTAQGTAGGTHGFAVVHRPVIYQVGWGQQCTLVCWARWMHCARHCRRCVLTLCMHTCGICVFCDGVCVGRGGGFCARCWDGSQAGSIGW